MASLSTRKLCSTINGCKQTAAINCEGCLQAFCTKHFLDHRHLLGEEMNVIISEHNHLQHTLSQSTEPDSHPFVKKINEWEKESVAKIQQKAEELRLDLFKLISMRNNEILSTLQQLSEELNENRENDNFIEMDLQQWKITLENLKAKLDSSLTFSFDQHDNIPLVQDISIMFTIENEVFEQVFDSIVQIKQCGQVVIHDTSHNYTEIRGKNEYITGRHKIRLCIEQSADRWTFLGITSKSILLQKQSSSSKSSYGWTNNNYFWLNGECHPNKSSPRIEMKTNDMISLIFDCDNHKILMINERTNAKYELIVNTDHCPFPWQFHVNLYEANSRIRILSF
ncbi:unnamed protein product [Rotaria sp. Silwood2]|nr:unnamed protein product [Rotaria sp. Silwood2]CAF4724754.1 unnamed protein product [Rotaria sp. Silwood2]